MSEESENLFPKHWPLVLSKILPKESEPPPKCEALEACRAPASALVLVLHPLVALVLGLSRSASPALLPADTTATRPPVRPYQGCTTKTRAKAQPLQKHNQPVQKSKTSAKPAQKHNHEICKSPNKQPNNHLTDTCYNPSGLKMQATFWNDKKMCFKAICWVHLLSGS